MWLEKGVDLPRKVRLRWRETRAIMVDRKEAAALWLCVSGGIDMVEEACKKHKYSQVCIQLYRVHSHRRGGKAGEGGGGG